MQATARLGRLPELLGFWRRISGRSQFRRFLRTQPIGTASLGILVIVAVLAIIAPLVAADPLSVSLDRLQSPGRAHIMGTDNFGRDVWSRVAFGAQVSMVVAIGTSVLASSIAITVGLAGGYARGLPEKVIEVVIDVFMAFPGLVFLIAAAALVPGAGVWKIVILLGLLGGMRSARVVRAAVWAIRSSGYVDAATSVGASPLRVALVHVLPNTFGATMAMTTLLWGFAILAEAALSFIGLGVPPPNPSWGAMISESREFMEIAPWTLIAPGTFLVLTVFAVNMFGDALRDVFDPRLQGSERR